MMKGLIGEKLYVYGKLSTWHEWAPPGVAATTSWPSSKGNMSAAGPYSAGGKVAQGKPHASMVPMQTLPNQQTQLVSQYGKGNLLQHGKEMNKSQNFNINPQTNLQYIPPSDLDPGVGGNVGKGTKRKHGSQHIQEWPWQLDWRLSSLGQPPARKRRKMEDQEVRRIISVWLCYNLNI